MVLEGVTVTAQVNKAHALNPTALVGTKMISVEESKRYGGAFDDIVRVVKRNIDNRFKLANSGIDFLDTETDYFESECTFYDWRAMLSLNIRL